MNDNSFEIIERVCMTGTSHQHCLLMQAKSTKSGETVWIVGDDQLCAITRADFLRNPYLDYDDVLIQEFFYKEHSPESVGTWRPLIEEMVKFTLEKYQEHDGLVHVYPKWIPVDMPLPLPRQELIRNVHQIIFYRNGDMDTTPLLILTAPSAEASGQEKEEC